jgi:hypothetical protein
MRSSIQEAQANKATLKNLQHLNQLIKYVSQHSKKCKLLIMGDFDFPHIDWSNWTTRMNNQAESTFLQTCMDALLATQHVLKPTRGRLGQNANTLDLIFTQRDDNSGPHLAKVTTVVLPPLRLISPAIGIENSKQKQGPKTCTIRGTVAA